MGSPLAITGIGMASTLGSRVETAAAAFRAGINRAQPIAGLMADTVEGDEVPIIGHQARPSENGLEGFALWLHLAHWAWNDLLRFIAVEPVRMITASSRLGLILVLPSITAERFGWEDDNLPGVLAEHLVEPLLRRIGLVLPPERCCVMTSGHAGAAEAFRLAEEGLGAGRWEYVAVLAVDSHLDPASLDYLLAENRLKSPDQPTGLMPGEAAAGVLLESPGKPRLGIDTGVRITAIDRSNPAVATTDDESEPPRLAAAEMAKNLMQAWEKLLSDKLPALAACDHYVDLTGESWRAEVWGNFLTLAAARGKGQGPLRTWLPAGGFGETGAASAVVAICLAVRAFQRAYAGHPNAAIWSLDANGDASVIQLDTTRASSVS